MDRTGEKKKLYNGKFGGGKVGGEKRGATKFPSTPMSPSVQLPAHFPTRGRLEVLLQEIKKP